MMDYGHVNRFSCQICADGTSGCWVEMTVLEINFFAHSKYLLPGIKASSNTYMAGSQVQTQ